MSSNHSCHSFLSNKFSLVEHVSQCLLMEIQVNTAILPASTPTPPLQSEFSFRAEDLCPAPPPAETHLIAPDPASPPDGGYYPLAPHSGYKLVLMLTTREVMSILLTTMFLRTMSMHTINLLNAYPHPLMSCPDSYGVLFSHILFLAWSR